MVPGERAYAYGDQAYAYPYEYAGGRELQGVRGDRGYDDTYLVFDRQNNIGELGGEGTFGLAHDPGDEIVEIVLTLTAAQFPEETQLRTLAGLNAIGEDAAALDEAQAALEIPAPIDPGDIQHNDLGGKQGGQAGQYYHLTESQLALVDPDQGGSEDQSAWSNLTYDEGDSS